MQIGEGLRDGAGGRYDLIRQSLIASINALSGPSGYALSGTTLTISGVQLSPYDTYRLMPWNSSCPATAQGLPVLPSATGATDTATLTLSRGQHSLCYNHRPTANASGAWRLLAPDLEVRGPTVWAPAQQPKPFQEFVAVFKGYGLSVGDLFNVVPVQGGSGGGSPAPAASPAGGGLPAPAASPAGGGSPAPAASPAGGSVTPSPASSGGGTPSPFPGGATQSPTPGTGAQSPSPGSVNTSSPGPAPARRAGPARRSSDACGQAHVEPMRVTGPMVVNSSTVVLPLVLPTGSFKLCYFSDTWDEVRAVWEAAAGGAGRGCCGRAYRAFSINLNSQRTHPGGGRLRG